MTESAERLASQMPGLQVSEDGDAIIVRAESGTYTGQIPGTWEGRPVKVFTAPCEPAGPVLKLSACLLMAVLCGLVMAGLAALVVVLLVRCM